MVENAPINIMTADKNGIINYLNPKSLETLKSIAHVLPVPPDKVVGGSYDVFHRNPAHQRAMLANPKNLPHKAKIRLGEEILDLLVSPMYDADGQFEGPMVTWELITKQEHLNQEIARQRTMLTNAPVNILMADPDGKLIYANQESIRSLRKIESNLKVPVDKMIGQNIAVFHRNPATQQTIISNPRNMPHSAQIRVGEEMMSLLVTAVTDDNGNYLGPMVTWELITEKLELIRTLTETSNDLGTAAEELLAVSNAMTTNSSTTTAQATTAATAAEEVTAGISTVVTNTEEMAASIKEITKATNASSNMSNDASTKAKVANDIITKLGESSLDIGNVIKVISSIAQQTNLLALNATIEAARAGEAGKGFAVVANEVKELAKETASATNDITKKIEAIQSDSRSAVDSVNAIGDSIEQITNIANSIAASVEEQAAATNEVSRVITDSAKAVQEISQNIGQVSVAANQTSAGATQTNDAARKLGTLAEQLKNLVKQIRI
jgi:methyl-accepting chemotaxis protein